MSEIIPEGLNIYNKIGVILRTMTPEGVTQKPFNICLSIHIIFIFDFVHLSVLPHFQVEIQDDFV